MEDFRINAPAPRLHGNPDLHLAHAGVRVEAFVVAFEGGRVGRFQCGLWQRVTRKLL